MKTIAFKLCEQSGIDRSHVLNSISIPFAKSQLKHTNALVVHCTELSEPIPSQFQILAYWPDQSIKHLLVYFTANISANTCLNYTLSTQNISDKNNIPPSKAKINSTDKSLSICNEHINVDLSKDTIAWNSYKTSTKKTEGDSSTPYHSFLQYCDKQNHTQKIELNKSWHITKQGPLFTEVQAIAHIKEEAKLGNTFTVTLRVCNFSPLIEVKTQIHNPNRATHPGGLWDLGDTGSISFKSLSIITSTENTETIELDLDKKDDNESECFQLKYNATPISIYQDSSGGENWNSRNHIDHSGKLTTYFRGYNVSNKHDIIKTGNRAQPILSASNHKQELNVFLEKFWQDFPSALSFKDENICIDFFPQQNDRTYELQGGERKTMTCHLLFSKDKQTLKSLRQQLRPILDYTQFNNIEAFSWLNLPNQQDKTNEQLQEIINYGLNGEHNFFAKREAIDEFGWRNFGDIFADHETHYQKQNEPAFISHYNNQYDAIYGFSKQFTLSGDSRWFELMDDLARHVTDIDIYHTQEDRCEYNNGLFWHTDHYLDAHTSTHRTYTQHNTTSSVPGQTGGGPAAEHCYTTGLLQHYYLTGSEDSKNAVLELANWLVQWHEGTGGFLEQLLAIKKHDIPKLKAILKGDKPTTHTYPFTRGTGNYLNAMLDAWQLTNDNIWLTRIESVIKQTIHPKDDIEKRDLLNAEVSWSYLVLLQALSKYLLLKAEADSFDEHYDYTLASFKHYTQWMLENERPFLEDPDQLEFPNDTWTAQDIRKALLLQQAANFLPDNDDTYLRKSQTLLDYVCNKLSTSPEKHYARVIILIMLNTNPAHKTPTASLSKNDFDKTLTKPTLSLGKLLTRMTKRLLIGIIHIKISKEKNWLKNRLN